MVSWLHGKRRGSYDYEALAMRLELDEEIIQRYTTTRIDWRKVVGEVGATGELNAKFCESGKLYVSVTLR